MANDDARYRANLQGEVDSAALYRTLAKTEPNPDLAKVYDKLASVEEAHAGCSAIGDGARLLMVHLRHKPSAAYRGCDARTIPLENMWAISSG
jgi:hypothetical protein